MGNIVSCVFNVLLTCRQSSAFYMAIKKICDLIFGQIKWLAYEGGCLHWNWVNVGLWILGSFWLESQILQLGANQ